MKTLTPLFIFLISTNIALAAPIFCGTDKSLYTVTVNNNWTSAVVKVKDHAVEFGEMSCFPVRTRARTNRLLVCATLGVADAGFIASISNNPRNPQPLSLELRERSFMGTNTVSILPCVAAMNTAQ